METRKKLKFIRNFNGWSQEKMSEKLGMSLHGYAKIERGEVNVNLTRFKQIAETLGFEPAQLMGLDEKTVLNLLETNNSHHHICNTGNNCHVEYSECNKHQLEKLSLLLEQKEKEIMLLNQQITDLREMVNLLKQA
jgi:transcriptional regulator with XRE-family HTH domain